MCIDIVEIWFEVAGKLRQFSVIYPPQSYSNLELPIRHREIFRVIRPRQDCGGVHVLSFHVFISQKQDDHIF